jgi:MbtH protein
MSPLSIVSLNRKAPALARPEHHAERKLTRAAAEMGHGHEQEVNRLHQAKTILFKRFLQKGASMSMDEPEDNTIYKVVLNHEEQYSIWPADRENALGWNDAGKSGTKAECLAYIKEVWTDMRPLSLRKKMEESARSS